MDAQPRDIVRIIRQRLGMTQAEFAQALGWAPSTISRWESGRATPNRLALKIILAFGAEQGVRLKTHPEPDSGPGLPVPYAGAGSPGAPREPMSVEVVVTAPAGPPVAAPPPSAGRSQWEAELRFRVALARGGEAAQRGGRWLPSAVVAGAALCTVLALGLPRFDATPPVPTQAERRATVATRSDRDARARPRRRARRSPTEAAATTVAAAPPAAPPAIDVAAAPPPAPVALPTPRTARLGGVLVVGDLRRATFELDGRVLTLVEGGTLGRLRATRIGPGGVELTDASGAVRTVGVGTDLAVE